MTVESTETQEQKNKQLELNKQKNNSSTKWFFIFFNSISLFTSVYIQQDLSSQHQYYSDYFKDETEGHFEMYFNMMYAISFFFMVFFNLFIGYICDKYGGGLCIIVGSGFSLFGQFLALISIRFHILTFLFIGRFFILSAITVNIMSNAKIISKHFQVKDLGFANGTILTFQDLGIFFNMLCATPMTIEHGLLYSSMVLFIMSIVGIIAGFSTYYLDQVLSAKFNIVVKEQGSSLKEGFIQTSSCSKFMIGSIFLNIGSTVLVILLPAFLTEKFGYSPQKSGQISSFLPLGVLVLPIISKIIDLTQQPLKWLIPCGIMSAWALVQMSLGFMPIFSIVIYGIQYNMRWGAIFPTIEFLAKKGTESKVFSVIRCFRDMGSFFVTIASGFIHDYFHSYDNSLLLLAILQILASIFLGLAEMDAPYEKRKQDQKAQQIEDAKQK